MENATKALLIAGSVLIAILLIALGMKIFSSTSETTQQSQAVMDATAVSIFNNKFNQYLNKEIITPNEMRSLLQAIKVNNATNSHQVWCSISEEDLNSGQYKYFRLTKGLKAGNPQYDEEGYIIKITFNRGIN